MTNKEAIHALGELLQSDDGQSDHYFATVNKILDKEVPTRAYDPELDGEWESKNRR
jgi:hypothetical protein